MTTTRRRPRRHDDDHDDEHDDDHDDEHDDDHDDHDDHGGGDTFGFFTAGGSVTVHEGHTLYEGDEAPTCEEIERYVVAEADHGRVVLEVTPDE